MVAKIRVSFCMNAGPKRGVVAAAAVCDADFRSLLTTAANKLKLRKAALSSVRLFIWRSGAELPAAGPVSDVQNGDTIAVSLGEPYAGPAAAASAPAAAPPPPVRWHLISPQLAVVAWPAAAPMNASLARMSTLLEHPTHCEAESGAVVGHAAQRYLPSSNYEGHNLYAATLRAFERLAAAADADCAASAEELAFLDEWRRRGEPAVVIAFVSGAVGTLRHELCHARFALDAEYRRWCEAAWAARVDALGKWLGALGYHATRRADEFGAYLLTEPAQFWRGRLGADEVRSLRAEPPAARHAAWIRELALGADDDGRGVIEAAL